MPGGLRPFAGGRGSWFCDVLQGGTRLEGSHSRKSTNFASSKRPSALPTKPSLLRTIKSRHPGARSSRSTTDLIKTLMLTIMMMQTSLTYSLRTPIPENARLSSKTFIEPECSLFVFPSDNPVSFPSYVLNLCLFVDFYFLVVPLQSSLRKLNIQDEQATA